MKKLLIIAFATSSLLSGCSVIPYEDEYACKKPDALGKCQNMGDSYQEAITGIETAPTLKPASKQDDDDNQHQISAQHIQQVNSMTNNSYDRYIDSYYEQLQRLVVDPKNPIIRQPTQVRMLVLPYTSKDQGVMYMSRHIYWVHQRPQFIMGDYMKKPSEILDSPMVRNRGE